MELKKTTIDAAIWICMPLTFAYFFTSISLPPPGMSTVTERTASRASSCRRRARVRVSSTLNKSLQSLSACLNTLAVP